MELSRSSYYYQPQGVSPDKLQADTELRDRIEEIYNRERLHSALGYVSPGEFEQTSTCRWRVGNQPLRGTYLDPLICPVRGGHSNFGSCYLNLPYKPASMF